MKNMNIFVIQSYRESILPRSYARRVWTNSKETAIAKNLLILIRVCSLF